MGLARKPLLGEQVLEECLAVPPVLRRDLREEEAGVSAAANDQAIAAERRR